MVYAAHGYRCFICGTSGVEAKLHIGHLISRKDSIDFGLDAKIYDDPLNLVPMCEDCNNGLYFNSVEVALLAKAILIKRGKSV